MLNQVVSTYYFTEQELLKNESDIVPIIFEKNKFSDLALLAANSKYRCVLVVGIDGLFNNIITQGDILRYSTYGVDEDEPIAVVIAKKKKASVAINSVQSQMFINELNYSVVPIVDTNNKLIGVSIASPSNSSEKSKDVIPRVGLVMSGGKGKRLYPLTKEIPKPLLPLGRQSILEHVLDSLEYAGIKRHVLMAGYLSEKFIEFQEKTKREVSIFIEDEPLGTGGPLLKWLKDDRSNINELLNKYGFFTLLVCNGDLIFDISSKIVMDFEESADPIMLIARNHNFSIKFGVLSKDNENYLDEFKEKPVYEFLVNTGIYMFKIDKPFLEIFDELNTTSIDMPNLLNKLEKEFGLKVRVREIVGNYIDVGTKEDLIEVSAFFKE